MLLLEDFDLFAEAGSGSLKLVLVKSGMCSEDGVPSTLKGDSSSCTLVRTCTLDVLVDGLTFPASDHHKASPPPFLRQHFPCLQPARFKAADNEV